MRLNLKVVVFVPNGYVLRTLLFLKGLGLLLRLQNLSISVVAQHRVGCIRGGGLDVGLALAALSALSVVFFLSLVAVLKSCIIGCQIRMTVCNYCVFKDIQGVVIFLLFILFSEFDVNGFIFEIVLGKYVCDLDALSSGFSLSVDILGTLWSRF